MFEEVGKPENAEAYVRDRLERHEKIFGFGHAVYKTYDPRARILKRLSEESSERAGQAQLHQIAEAIEVTTFEQRGLYPNVDFYAAVVFHVLGVPTDLMTLFAAARMAGWTAHVREQYAGQGDPARFPPRRAGRPDVGPDRGPRRTVRPTVVRQPRPAVTRRSGAGRDRLPRRRCEPGRPGRSPSDGSPTPRRSPGSDVPPPPCTRAPPPPHRRPPAPAGRTLSRDVHAVEPVQEASVRDAAERHEPDDDRGPFEHLVAEQLGPSCEPVGVVDDLRPDDIASGVELRLQSRRVVRIGERHVGHADQVARRIRDLRPGTGRPLVADPRARPITSFGARSNTGVASGWSPACIGSPPRTRRCCAPSDHPPSRSAVIASRLRSRTRSAGWVRRPLARSGRRPPPTSGATPTGCR